MSQMDRKTLLERAGIGAGVVALPALFGGEAALAGAPPSSRIAVWIAVNRVSPAVASPGVWPTIAWVGIIAFRPEQKFIKGGGNYQIFDWNLPAAQRTPIATGAWTTTEFLSWTTDNLSGTAQPSFGQIQPSVLDAKIDLEGLGQASIEFACNVGFAGISTGRPETVRLWDVPGYPGIFDNPVPTTAASLTSSSVPGYPNVPITA
jgi:hypothetical protein